MARLTSEGRAEEALESCTSYLRWSVIEKAVNGEQILQDKEAFRRRKTQVDDQLRRPAQHEKLGRFLLFVWSLSVLIYLFYRFLRNEFVTDATIVGSFFAYLAVVTYIIKYIRRTRTTITAVATLAGSLALAVLAWAATSYLEKIPEIARHWAASGAIGGLRAMAFALYTAFALWVLLEASELMRIRTAWRQSPDLLLFHHLAMLAKKLSDPDLPSHGTFSDQKELCANIEQSARAVDAMAEILASPWHPGDESLRQSFASTASGLRELKHEAAFPNDTYEKLAEQACRLCMISATGLYGLLPKANTLASSVASSRRTRIAPSVKRWTAAVIPFALYLLLREFSALLNISKADLSAIGFASLLWLLHYIIRSLDPSSSDILTNLKDTPFT